MTLTSERTGAPGVNFDQVPFSPSGGFPGELERAHRSPLAEPVPAEASPTGPAIEFARLRTRWRRHRRFASALDLGVHREYVLDGLCLILPAGRISVLLGARGAGKTLLASHLVGATAPDEGAVLVDGESVWDMAPPRRGELLDGFGVFCGGTRIWRSALIESLSVRDNLAAELRRRGHHEGVDQTVRDYLRRFDLIECAQVAGGEVDPASRRRLGVALALIGDPPVVVIDEPGQALDLRHLESIIDAIKGWQALTGATMLITLHSLAAARELGHRVAVIRDGRVLAQGDPERVLAGVVDDESFERRFGTDMGGFAEADPERGRLALQEIRKAEAGRQMGLVLAFCLLGMTILALLLSGMLTNPLIAG